MKAVLTILIAAFFIVAIGGGAYYYFAVFSSRSEVPEKATKTAETVSEEEYDTETGYSDCPEGIVCVGSDYVPALPEVTLGSSEVYAADKEDLEEDEKRETQEKQEEQIQPNTPQNILVTNKDFSNWSVVWITDAPQTGYVLYGTSSDDISQKAYDERDVSVVNLAKRYTHHVTVSTDLEDETEVTYYFKVVSGEEEFSSGGDFYTYENAPLTSSPSSPASVSITSTSDFEDSQDFIVVARVLGDNRKSTSVSKPFNSSGGVDLPIGIVRDQSLNTYFSVPESGKLEVKVYGPQKYTGYIDNASISDEVIEVETAKTGYRGDIYSQSYGFSGSDEQIYDTDPDTDNDSIPQTDKDAESPPDSLPQTGIEDSWMFTSIFGLVILLLGTLSALLIFPWNFKKLWETKVIKDAQ